MKIYVFDENYSPDRIEYPWDLAKFVVKNAIGKASEADFLAAFDVIEEMDVKGGLVLSAVYATEMAAKGKKVDSLANVTFYVDLDEDGEIDLDIDDISEMFKMIKQEVKGESKVEKKLGKKAGKVKGLFGELAA